MVMYNKGIQMLLVDGVKLNKLQKLVEVVDGAISSNNRILIRWMVIRIGVSVRDNSRVIKFILSKVMDGNVYHQL
jgi:hypothetical protein